MSRRGIDYDITEVKCFGDGQQYIPCAVPEELSKQIFDWLETEVKNNHVVKNAHMQVLASDDQQQYLKTFGIQ